MSEKRPDGEAPEAREESSLTVEEIEEALRIAHYYEGTEPPDVADEDFPVPKPTELEYPDVVDQDFPSVH